MTNAERHLMTLFAEALDFPSPPERAAYLDRACGKDQALRQHLEALLQAHAQVGRFLDPQAAVAGATSSAAGKEIAGAAVDDRTALPQSGTEVAGAQIGPYKLIEQIGEGGMGTVWMAQQTAPVKRLVALKLIKAGMDSKQIIARFEAERQALALMEHPNIARVLDAGTTSAGRPYFIMDLVKGVPITKYCDEHHLTPRQRLELFLPVCQAVQHAHTKGVIHRDLKPSNVLVALYDGKPVPKVIDFGVAKAAGQALTEKTLVTGFGALVGTPEYMSPEQAEVNQLDVDTRSDVYALGVLLYELLAGSPPFTRKESGNGGMLEMLRVIREQEPPKPSTKLSTAEGLPTLAANRGTLPAQLTRLVRGELDWIVMRCLEKDRNRRYETANGFALDVQRYLADEPVLACPPSAGYRLRKFARRNKGGLAAAALVLFFLMLLGSGVGWAVRDRAAREAEAARQQAARQRETERAATAALAQADALLAEGDKQIDQPERWQATVRLAEAALERAEDLAATGEATEDLAERVRRVRAAVVAAQTDSRLLVELDRIRLEKAAVKAGRYQFARATPLYAKLLEDYGVEVAAPETAAARVRSSRLREAILAALEDWCRSAGDEAERRRLLAVLHAAVTPDAFQNRWWAAVGRREGAALVKLARGPQVQHLPPTVLVNLARDLRNLKEWAAAEQLLRAAQERKPGDFWINHDLGMVLLGQKPARAEEAVGYLRVALALRSDSPGVYLNLGEALRTKGDLDGAIHCYQAALRIDANYADAHADLGLALYAKKDVNAAIPEYRIAIQIDSKVANYHSNLGDALTDKGDIEGAIREYRTAVEIHPEYYYAHFRLGRALHDKRDFDGAMRHYRAALRVDPKYVFAHNSLGIALAEQGDIQAAIREFQAALQIDPNSAEAHSNLGTALRNTKDLEGAIREFRAALQIDPKLACAHVNLGSALAARKDLKGAMRHYRAALRIDPNSAPAHGALGNALYDVKDLDGAIREYRTAIQIDPKYDMAHNDWGNALYAKKDVDGAIREYRTALRLNPKNSLAHRGLGSALAAKGDRKGAIREYRTALLVNPNDSYTHCALAIALRDEGDLEAAIREYRVAIGLNTSYAEAHCNLGLALQAKGRFQEAVRSLKAGHELGSTRKGWGYPSAAWLRRAERLVELDAKLPKVLSREARPRNVAEQMELAGLCLWYKKLPAAAARLYGEAFAAEPKLAGDVRSGNRYNAACAAALAGCGQGKDADKIDGKGHAGLRDQALGWLRADLVAWRALLRGKPDKVNPAVQQKMQHWQQDPEFAGVRGDALKMLPESERHDWEKLWQEVEDLRRQAGGSRKR
jgi:tetratricopeptide (TPR) repeat protein